MVPYPTITRILLYMSYKGRVRLMSAHQRNRVWTLQVHHGQWTVVAGGALGEQAAARSAGYGGRQSQNRVGPASRSGCPPSVFPDMAFPSGTSAQ